MRSFSFVLLNKAIALFLLCTPLSFSLHGTTLPCSPSVENLDRVESMCKAFSLEDVNASAALQEIKAFFDTDQSLYFKKLSEGSFNPPALVFYFEGSVQVPLGVLKCEQDRGSAEKRMQMLDALIAQGCRLIPRVIRSKKGEYLVNLGGQFYSCIEYVEPDEENSLSFEQMLELTSKLHACIQGSQLEQSHFRKTLDWFFDTSHFILDVDPQLIDWDPSIFANPTWERCVQSTHYLISPAFRKIYDSLPVQIIHGDIAPKNIVFSSGQPLFIDLESMRTDIRIRDFSIFSRGAFLDHFLLLLEESKLEHCLRMNYGKLEKNEIVYFPLIVLLECCGTLAWSLDELAKALSLQDVEQTHRFREMAVDTIQEINKLYEVTYNQQIDLDVS